MSFPKFPSLLAIALYCCSLLGADLNSPSPYQSPGARKMAERLEQITRGLNPMENPFMNAARVEKIRAELQPLLDATPSPDNFKLRFTTHLKYATELLNAGKSEAAIQNLKDLRAYLEKYATVDPKTAQTLQLLTATAYLRLGEQENCLLHHNIESCLMPIRGGGVHTELRGSQGAKEVLAQMLAGNPKDLRARWLYNLASMTLGEYPEKVPPPWLIPPKVFDSNYDIKRFPDIAPALKLDVDGLAGGVVLDDFDNDDDLDLVVSSMGTRDQIRFFVNNGNGAFTERTR